MNIYKAAFIFLMILNAGPAFASGAEKDCYQKIKDWKHFKRLHRADIYECSRDLTDDTLQNKALDNSCLMVSQRRARTIFGYRYTTDFDYFHKDIDKLIAEGSSEESFFDFGIAEFSTNNCLYLINDMTLFPQCLFNKKATLSAGPLISEAQFSLSYEVDESIIGKMVDESRAKSRISANCRLTNSINNYK